MPKIDDFQFFLIYLGYRILKSLKHIFVVYVRFTLRHFLKGSGNAVATPPRQRSSGRRRRTPCSAHSSGSPTVSSAAVFKM